MPIDFTPDAQQPSSAPVSTFTQPRIDFTPDPILPKMPDTLGVQKMAQDNLVAHDNQEPGEDGEPKQPLSPQERLNTGAGFPVDRVISGQAKPSDFTQAHRTAYVNGLNNGSWVDSSDAMPTWLHSITPVAAGFAAGAYSPFKPIVSNTLEALKNTATQTGEAMSEPYNEKNVPGFLEPADIAVKTLGKVGNAISGAVGAVFSPVTGALTASAEPLIPAEARAIASLTKQNPNLTPEQIHQLAQEQGGDLTNAAMLGLSTPKVAKGLFGEILPPEKPGSTGGPLQIGGATLKDVTPQEGHWDNHPGSEPIVQAVAKKLGKEPSEVTTPEVDQAIAEGGKDLMPAGKDFKSVSGVTGISEEGMKNLFQITGITPEQVFLANQRDKTVGEQVSAGQVPDQWKHLVPEGAEAPKTATSEASEASAPLPASYESAYHFDTDSYGVKNEKGEFVKTGFGSEDEAKDYIEHKAERDAIEGEKPLVQSELHPLADESTINPTGTTRLYRGEGSGGAMGNSVEGGEWFTTDINKAEKYGNKLKFFDVTPEDLKKYGYGHGDGHANEFILDHPELLSRVKELPTEKAPATELDVAGKQGEQLAAANEGRLKPTAKQKAADDGLFDVAGRGQGDLLEQKTVAKPQGIVAPSAIGKVTSLRGFLSQENLKAKFNEGKELVSIMKDGEKLTGDVALDYAHQLAKEYGYMTQDLPDRPSAYASELADLLHETDGGREATRIQDADRVAKAREDAELAKQKDPAYIAEQAHKAGIDTDKLEGESDKKWLKRMNDALKDFQTGIAEPTIEAVQNMWGDESGSVPSNVLQEIRDTIAPTMAGKSAQQAAIVLRNAYGMARRERARDETTLSKVAKIAAKMDDAARKDFYRYVEGRSTGEALSDKALQPLADSVRAVYQRMRGQLEAMPETRMMNFVRDYFTHQWADPEAAAKFTNEFIAAQGSGRSLKKRTLPTIADGLAAGLELKESNPVRAVSAYLGSMTNYIASVNGLRSIVHDLGAEYAVKGMQPEGYEPLVGRNAERIENARIDPTSGKMIPARNMQLYAPKEVARIYNRFYSKGFEDTGIKSTYELARDAINTNTMFELGLSTYHLGTINIQSINQDIGRILKNAIVGDWKGVMDAAKKLITPGAHLIEGRKLVQQYNGLKDHGINMEAMAEHFSKANLRIGQDPLSVISKKGFVHGAMRGELPEIIEHLKQQAKSGYGVGLVKSGAEVAARTVSDIAAPIFQYYVPAIKMSSFSDLMSDWLRQNPKASDAEIAVAQARIGNLVDDRFGEMNMENVFWHKMMKQITGLVFRAPGWDLGLIRQVGGAAKDFYSTLADAATGKKFNPDLLDRQLYMVAAVGLYAAVNSALTYLYTGVPPTEQELRDFIAYRTGGMRKQFGKWFDERGVIPGHGRELVNMYPVPGQGIVSGLTEEVGNKTNTLPKNIWQDITNHDWRQKDIYDPASKSWIQSTPGVAQVGHVLGGFKPFAIDNMMENEKDEGTNISPFARALGVRPAGTRITDREDLEKFLNKKH